MLLPLSTHGNCRSAIGTLMVFATIFCLMFMIPRNGRAQTDTVFKSVHYPGEQVIMTFHDSAGHNFAIAIHNNDLGAIEIDGPSGPLNSGVYTVHTLQGGTYSFVMTYHCTDPNCTDSGRTVVKINVEHTSRENYENSYEFLAAAPIKEVVQH